MGEIPKCRAGQECFSEEVLLELQLEECIGPSQQEDQHSRQKEEQGGTWQQCGLGHLHGAVGLEAADWARARLSGTCAGTSVTVPSCLWESSSRLWL